MIIKSLKLKNYRNYDLLDLTFDPKTNILYGDNAQGKTNILEALYLSGTTKSHRGTKDRDMIQFGYDESHLETVVEKKGITLVNNTVIVRKIVQIDLIKLGKLKINKSSSSCRTLFDDIKILWRKENKMDNTE